MFKTFLSRKLYSILISSTLSLLVITLLVLSDSVIAGVFLDENAVAAICLVTPAYSLAAFVGCMISLGVPILYNRAMGEFNKKKANQCFAFGFTMAIATGLFLLALFTFAGDTYLRFYEPTQTVFDLAKSYLFWYKITFILLPLSTLMLEMILADGDETLSLIAGIVQIVVNIAASAILASLIGIAGIGLGSLIGVTSAILTSFVHFLKKSNSLKPGIFFSFQWLFDVCKYSLVDAGNYLFLALYIMLMNRFITYAYGSEMLVLGAIIIFLKDVQVLFDGVGEAFTPPMNIYLGEESYKGVERCYNLSQKIAIAEGIVLTVLMIAFAPLIIRLYDIKDAVTFSYAVNGVRIESLGLIFLSLLYLLTSYYLLIDKIKLSFVMSGMRDLFVAVPVATILGYFYGITGMFAGVALAPALAYALSILYIRVKYGKENYPLLLSERTRNFKHGFYEFKLSPESIINIQKQSEKFLITNGIDKKIVMRVKLLIEEVYMLIYEKNGSDKPVYAECTVIIRDSGIQIITKDDGVLFDLSSEDVVASSITEFMVSGYMEKMRNNKKHLTTMSYNRNTFKVSNKA